MTAAAIKVLFFSGDSTVARWEIVIPVLAAVVLIYTLYKNIHPAGEPNWEPITALVWLVLALVALVVAPRVTTRLGQRLAADEGLTAPAADLAAPDALSRCRRLGACRQPTGGRPSSSNRAPGIRSNPAILRRDTMDILVLRHVDCEPPAAYQPLLEARGAVKTVRLGVDPLPDHRDFGAVVANGRPDGGG